MYGNMRQYSKALTYHERGLEILQTTLSPNDPHLAISYDNIGSVYSNMGDYPKALSYFEHAAVILERSSSLNHSHIQSVRASIEFVKEEMENNLGF
jgi:tetratricopeptide (TPR) repeat protein